MQDRLNDSQGHVNDDIVSGKHPNDIGLYVMVVSGYPCDKGTL